MILPGAKNIKAWSRTIPDDVDWLFFESRRQGRLVLGPEVELISTGQMRGKGMHTLPLSQRSWWGYAHSRAKFAARLRPGELDLLPPDRLLKLSAIHRKLAVPTLIPTRMLKASLPRCFPVVKRHTFLAARGLAGLGVPQRAAVMRAWIKAHPWLEFPKKTSLRELPKSVRLEIDRRGLRRRIGYFYDRSGPNCFANVAGAISARKFSERAADRWLLYRPMLSTLKKLGFKKSALAPKNMNAGDVVTFERDGEGVHAAYSLGEGWFFEKWGQDFYNPTMLSPLSELKRAWPRCRPVVWRKA